MGQKINPHGLRVGVIKDWDSVGSQTIRTSATASLKTIKIRKFVKKSFIRRVSLKSK